jgi:hypothetical protein
VFAEIWYLNLCISQIYVKFVHKDVALDFALDASFSSLFREMFFHLNRQNLSDAIEYGHKWNYVVLFIPCFAVGLYFFNISNMQ